MSIPVQMEFNFASSVPEMAKQEAEACNPVRWDWVEASVWTERMLAALGNGVKGGKWYSLVDKVYNPRTLRAAWKKVAAGETNIKPNTNVSGQYEEIYKTYSQEYDLA